MCNPNQRPPRPPARKPISKKLIPCESANNNNCNKRGHTMEHSKIFSVFIPLGGVLWMSSSLLISEAVGKPNHQRVIAEAEPKKHGLAFFRCSIMCVCKQIYVYVIYIQYGPLAKLIYTFCIELFDIHQDGWVRTQQLHQTNSVGGRGIRSCHNLVKARVGES